MYENISLLSSIDLFCPTFKTIIPNNTSLTFQEVVRVTQPPHVLSKAFDFLMVPSCYSLQNRLFSTLSVFFPLLATVFNRNKP